MEKIMDIMKQVNNYNFIFFLQWLDESRGWEAREIISVVEKPNKYQKEFDEYIEEEKLAALIDAEKPYKTQEKRS
jgi:hypothetical protein